LPDPIIKKPGASIPPCTGSGRSLQGYNGSIFLNEDYTIF